MNDARPFAPRVRPLLFGIAAAALLACSSQPSGPSCASGPIPCTCASGLPGLMDCDATGLPLGVCQCTAPDAGAPVDGGASLDGGGHADGGATQDGGVSLDGGPFTSLDGGEVTGNHAPTCTCGPVDVTITPRTTLQLTAHCTDVDQDRLTYAWTVESRPSGSAEPIQNPQSANATFTPNTATTPSEAYVIRLTADDGRGGTGGCTTAYHVMPPLGLYVQVAWDKDVSDVDLHLLRRATDGGALHGPTGFFNSPNDCHFQNRNPDWGVPGTTADNPRLDLDDTNGYGPEIIVLDQPAADTYAVGVHYYCDDSQGPTNATVRIFCDGALASQLGPQVLAASGAFWDVATIQFPGCHVTALGATQSTTQGCAGGFGF